MATQGHPMIAELQCYHLMIHSTLKRYVVMIGLVIYENNVII